MALCSPHYAHATKVLGRDRLWIDPSSNHCSAFSTHGDRYAIDGPVPKRSGNWGDVAALRNVYECSDGGYVAMSATMSHVEKLAVVIERPELVEDPVS